MTKDEKLMEHIKASPFHRSASYSVNIDLYNFDQSLLMYNDILEEQAAKNADQIYGKSYFWVPHNSSAFFYKI